MSKRALALLFVTMVAAAPAFAKPAAGLAPFPLPYRVIDTQWSVDGTTGLGRLDVLVQEGRNDINRFKIHRLVKVDERGRPLAPRRLQGAVILVAPQFSDFGTYFIGDAAMAPYLAQRGFDVYGYTPRPSLLAEGACAARDCSPMAGWGVDTYVRDLELIRVVATVTHLKKPAIGGMSLGAMLTLAAVNRSPRGYAGAIVWEGTMHFSDPTVAAAFEPLFETYVQTLSAGLVYDDQTPAYFKTVWMLMQTDPDGASPFAEGVTNRQYALLATTTPAEPPLGEAPGYTYLTGDIVNGYYYTDEAPLGEFIRSWASYDSVALLRDLALSRAGSGAFVDHLHRFRGSVLAIEAGHGFGASMEGSLALLTRAASIDRLVFAERSHVDVLYARDQETTVTAPTYNWLVRSVVPRM